MLVRRAPGNAVFSFEGAFQEENQPLRVGRKNRRLSEKPSKDPAK